MEFRPIENVILTGSARGDWNSVIKKDPWTLSPRVSLIYSPVKDHTFRASWGIAFRKPSFLEYGMRMQDLSQLLRLSNPDLVNEVNRSTEFGYAARLTDRIKMNLDLYYSQYRKFIEFDAHELMYVNSGKDADGYGGELNIDSYIVKGLDGFANYAYFNAIPKGGIDYSIDTRVSPQKAYPHHKVNAGFRVKHEGLTFNLWAHYVSSFWREIVDPNATAVTQQITKQVFMKDYILLNAKLGYKFLKGKTEIGLTAFNLLNNKHREFPGFVWDTESVYNPPRSRTPPESFGGQELGMKLLGFIAIEF